MKQEHEPKTLSEHGDTLVSVNSVGKLREWIILLPIKQSEFDGTGGEELDEFDGWQETGVDQKNDVWERVIQYVGGVIYAGACASKEIVWHTRPEFTATIPAPDKLLVSYKFRCAFVPKGD